MLKSFLIFPLISCLVLIGVPYPSSADINRKTLNAKEKAALTALSSTDLLSQKAGDGQAELDNWQTRHEKTTGKPSKEEKSNDIASTNAVLCSIVSGLVVLICSLIGNFGGGSC